MSYLLRDDSIVIPRLRSFTTLLCLGLALWVAQPWSALQARRIAPLVREMAMVAETIVLVRAKSGEVIKELMVKGLRLPYSRVSVEVVEVLKGDPKLKKLTITTDQHEEGDCAAYVPRHGYLVFLRKKGRTFHVDYGMFGVFEKVGTQIRGWPKPGERAYHKPDRSAEYAAVKKEIAGILRGRR